ncbi:MAG: cytochrome c [Imperialibacter sp.]|uniref:cytochrome c n=1 Tax=Imperialibacter sp. TaxID=2038411 RepID=UPI0032EAACB1
MLKKTFKWVGIVLACIFSLLIIAYAYIYLSTEARFNKKYSFREDPVTLSTDSAVLARGAHLVAIKACDDCHGPNLGGKIFLDDPLLGRIVSSNLTSGKGGRPSDYGVVDWLKALRHAVNQEGKPLLFMPSHEIVQLSKADIVAILSYLQTIPPVDSDLPSHDIRFLGRILTHFDKVPLLPVDMIDHNMGWPKEVEENVSAAFGKYLVAVCTGCHRENLKGGGPIAPGLPPVADITSTGRAGQMTEEQFMNTLRTGITPEGRTLDPKEMPWPTTSKYTETELKAIYAYLKSI